MYKIEQKNYGIKMLFSGAMTLDEIQNWAAEAKKLITKQKEGFGVLVDVKEMKIMNRSVIDIVIEVQAFARDHKVGRNANIVESRLAQIQQTRVAKESNIYSFMRYIDGSTDEDSEKIALDWITKGIDPDLA